MRLAETRAAQPGIVNVCQQLAHLHQQCFRYGVANEQIAAVARLQQPVQYWLIELVVKSGLKIEPYCVSELVSHRLLRLLLLLLRMAHGHFVEIEANVVGLLLLDVAEAWPLIANARVEGEPFPLLLHQAPARLQQAGRIALHLLDQGRVAGRIDQIGTGFFTIDGVDQPRQALQWLAGGDPRTEEHHFPGKMI